MKKYIFTVSDSCDPYNYDFSYSDVIMIEDLIECRDCIFSQKTDGIYRCDVNGLRVYNHSFCNHALAKNEEDNHE